MPKLKLRKAVVPELPWPTSVNFTVPSETLEWVPVSGRASIYSLTVALRAAPAFRDDLPFAIALVDLEEGPRMMTRILVDDPVTIAIGDAVEVVFCAQTEGPPLPFFRLQQTVAQSG